MTWARGCFREVEILPFENCVIKTPIGAQGYKACQTSEEYWNYAQYREEVYNNSISDYEDGIGMCQFEKDTWARIKDTPIAKYFAPVDLDFTDEYGSIKMALCDVVDPMERDQLWCISNELELEREDRGIMIVQPAILGATVAQYLGYNEFDVDWFINAFTELLNYDSRLADMCLQDVHYGNIGMYKGHPVFIDYGGLGHI